MAGTSYLGQEPAEAFFGLGLEGRVERLEINWPDGNTTAWNDLPADRIMHVTPEGTGGDPLSVIRSVP